MKKSLLYLFFVLLVLPTNGQLIHSHNDYQKDVPLYRAYAAKSSSVECDMYCVNGKLLVGHDPSDIDSVRDFERMYLEPIVAIFRNNGGRAWLNDSLNSFTLVVEIKSDNPDAYVSLLSEKLGNYKDVFDPSVNPQCCKILITGWKFPDDFSRYPDYLKYDFQYNGCDWNSLSSEKLSHVGMISMNFSVLSKWNGEGSIDSDEKADLQKVIDFAHSLKKPVRFWGAPDTPSCWDLLCGMGADFINTDHVIECAKHFGKYGN